MKVNLWVLADQLEDFELISNISETDVRIEGLRVCAGEDQAVESSFVYLYPEHEDICLRNGADSVCLPHVRFEEALNAVLAAFEKLRDWEAELTRLAAERALPELLDCGGTLLENPLMLSDSAGNVLAMSGAWQIGRAHV